MTFPHLILLVYWEMSSKDFYLIANTKYGNFIEMVDIDYAIITQIALLLLIWYVVISMCIWLPKIGKAV